MASINVQKIQKYLGKVEEGDKRTINAIRKVYNAFLASIDSSDESEEAPKGKRGRKPGRKPGRKSAKSLEFDVGTRVSFEYKGKAVKAKIVELKGKKAEVETRDAFFTVPLAVLELA